MSREKLIISARSGDVEAQRELGRIYFEIERNYQSSFYWYTEAAENGDAFSQYEVGYMYEHGHGVELCYYEAVRWYKKSAENGDEAAKRNNTELFYYLLTQAWDKVGHYGMVDLETTKHINPESLPE